MDHDHRPGHDAAEAGSSGQLQHDGSAARSDGSTAEAEAAKRRLESNTVEGFRDFLYDLLEEPIGELGCAGPPVCTMCPGGAHDTGLGTFSGVIEVTIDDQEYEILVTKAKSTRSFSRKDLNLDA